MDAPRLSAPPARRLSDPLGSQENRIDELRLYAAIAVVLGHSWHIAYGREARVPFQDWTIIGFHSLAVYVFFFLSGLLVTESAVRHAGRPYQFMSKRVRRIMPALVVNAVVVPPVLVATGAWTDASAATIGEYAARLISLFFIQYEHAGAFADNPFPGALNGSVWSLRHEVIVYALLFAAILTGALGSQWRRWAFLALLGCLVAVGGAVDKSEGGLAFLLSEGHLPMFAFLLGVVAHQFSRHVTLDWRLFLPGTVMLAASQTVGPDLVWLRELGTVAVVCAVTLLLAFPRGKGRRLTNDLSYGVYIYAWPMQQLVVMWCIEIYGTAPAPLGVFALTMPTLLIVSAISWKCVEEPALLVKQRAVGNSTAGEAKVAAA